MKIKIINHNREITLEFYELKDFNAMKLGITNCIDNSEKYTLINYSDDNDSFIFSANYLKNSLIVIPKIKNL